MKATCKQWPNRTDIFSRRKRSAVMAAVRSDGNRTTELKLAALLRLNRISGWRRRQPLFGRPDFTFSRRKLAVFVDGCFWHGCPVHGTKPKQNAEFWRAKIYRNQTRDRLVTRTLRARGWRVLRIWEHELRQKNERRLVRRLIDAMAPRNSA